MTGRRVPLGNVPNAANSPFRAVAAAATKRSREQIEVQEDLAFDLQPRAKRQALETLRPQPRTPPRKQPPQSIDGGFLNKQPSKATPTNFERKLLVAREGKAHQKIERNEKASLHKLDDIRRWQKHYKTVFPQFVFYFESIPEDIRIRCSKCVRSLGSREEKFFSKDVTHIVTTRTVPGDNDVKVTSETFTHSLRPTGSQPVGHARTINPSLLNRQNEDQGQSSQSKNKFTFETAASKRVPQNTLHDAEPRKSNAGNVDILWKAKEMGMKLWTLDKLQRVLSTMYDFSNEPQAQAGHGGRVRVSKAAAKEDREAELSRMLRNERLNGPSDRDFSVAMHEFVSFKGPHIYIRDIDEKTKPIMVKDYAKPTTPELGHWPQFHAVSQGKCPFVDEMDAQTRLELEKAKAREQEMLMQKQGESRNAPRTRAAAVREDEAKLDATPGASRKRPLEESKRGTSALLPPPDKKAAPAFCPPPPTIPENAAKAVGISNRNPVNTAPKLFGGEPAASGMQPSNITSAIRSQMISSTAAAPGAKAGTSKEVHGLKRKVLEKNTRPALQMAQNRQGSVDPAAVVQAERHMPPVRQTRQQVQEMLKHIEEESTQSEGDEDVWMAEEVRRTERAARKAQPNEKQKPGYCENCKDRYNDFDDHIASRKHRKFALTQDNWKDLDRLLAHLGRRLKEPDSEIF